MITLRNLAVLLVLASFAQAKNTKIHQTGTLIQMDSVQCGFDENSGKSITGELLGTDSAHKKTHTLLCQEYILQSDRITYRIRPRDEKHPVLLPVGQYAEFRMDKDKMKLLVEGLDAKEREYVVVSMMPHEEDSSKTLSMKTSKN